MRTSGCEIIVLLGSNAPDAGIQMASVFNWLVEQITVTEASGVYTSPPFSGAGPEYLNRVVKGVFSGSADDFETIAKARENLQGRKRHSISVAIDIDLIIYNGMPVRPSDMNREYFLKGLHSLSAV